MGKVEAPAPGLTADTPVESDMSEATSSISKTAPPRLGAIAEFLTPAAWQLGDPTTTTQCLFATALADPDLVPAMPLLDQRFTLRELLEGAAVIAEAGLRIAVDRATVARPIGGEFRDDAEAQRELTRRVAGLPDCLDGRVHPVKAAAFLATAFAIEVAREEAQPEGWAALAAWRRSKGRR